MEPHHGTTFGVKAQVPTRTSACERCAPMFIVPRYLCIAVSCLLFTACTNDSDSFAPPSARSGPVRSRTILNEHDWSVTFKSGEAFSYHGLLKFKRGADSLLLEMRTRGTERQVNVRSIESISRGTLRASESRRHTSMINQNGCVDLDTCCNDFNIGCTLDVTDVCDPSVSFCCYMQGGGSYPCNPPESVVFGVGCEFDIPCGDDGNGSATGVGYFIFSHAYCWYDFASGDISCYARSGQPPPGPRNLFIRWSRLGQHVIMSCDDPGTFGRGLAYYYDSQSSGVLSFGFLPGFQKSLVYPDDFPGMGRPYSVAPASMESDWWQFGIQIPSQKVGVCNHIET
jgi:hypothetical protein